MAIKSDGVNDGHFIIGRGQGISQAIATEIGLTKAQCKKVDWESVFAIVKAARNNTTVKWGGESKLKKDGHTGNYIVNIGDEFKFSTDTWQQIVGTVKDSLTSKGVNIDNLIPTAQVTEEAETETEPVVPTASVEMAPEQPGPSEPSDPTLTAYSESDRFIPRAVDEAKTEKEPKKFLGIKTGKNIVKKYDANGKLVSESVVRKDGSTKEVTYFDEKGVQTHKFTFDKKRNITSKMLFDRQGKRVTQGAYVVHNNDGTTSIKEWDAKTLKDTRCTKYNTDGTVTVTDYDTDEKPQKETQFNPYANTFSAEYKHIDEGYSTVSNDVSYIVTDIDSNGKPVRKTCSVLGDYNETFVQDLDSKGNITKYTHYDDIGMYYNTFNEQHKILRNGRDFADYYELYEYEDDGVTVKTIRTYNLDGTPFKETEE